MNPVVSTSSLLLAANLGAFGELQREFLTNVQSGVAETAVFGHESAAVSRLASEALLGRTSVASVADRVWGAMAVDFGHSIPSAHVRREGDVVEIRCDEREFAAADAVDMYAYLGTLDAALGGALSLTGRERKELILRFPPLTHFERAARMVYGEDAAGWIYVKGEIPRDDVNRAHAKRRQQIGLPLKPLYFPQAKRVIHPFPFAFHDVYHAVDIAGIHPELLKIGVTLYDTLKDLPADLRELPFIGVQFHELSELLHVRNMSLDNFFKWTFVPFEMTVRRSHQMLMPSREREILAARCRRYVDVVFEDWPARLHEDRRPSVASYRRVLDVVVRNNL